MYQVVVERSAEKDLKRLSSGIRSRVAVVLRALGENPRPLGSRKLARTKSDWRVRVGDYRIIMKSLTSFESCECYESVIVAKLIVNHP
jgi:mRNA interferase RelE/StbE